MKSGSMDPPRTETDLHRCLHRLIRNLHGTFTMRNTVVLLFLCGVCVSVSANAETFVLASEDPTHPASIEVPSSAVLGMTSNVTQFLGTQVSSAKHSMLLVGDVTISVQGVKEPLVIKADQVLLTLVDDGQTEPARVDYKEGTGARSIKFESSDRVVFTGDVVIKRTTNYGPFQIKADKAVQTSAP